MRGISGYISNKKLVTENAINKTLNLMHRRGPDAQNFFSYKFLKR